MLHKDFQFKFDVLRFYYRTFNIELTLKKFNVSYSFLVSLINKYSAHGLSGLKSVYDRFPTQLRLSAIADKFIWKIPDKELIKKYKVPNICYINSWFNQYNNKYDSSNDITTTIKDLFSMSTLEGTPISKRLSYKLRYTNGKLDKNLTYDEVRARILAYCPNFKRKYEIIQYYLVHGFAKAKKDLSDSVSEDEFKFLVKKYKAESFDGLFDMRKDEERELKALWQAPLAQITMYDLERATVCAVMEKELIKKYISLKATTKK